MMQKVAQRSRDRAGFRHSTTEKLCQPSNIWGRIRQQKERNGLHLPSAVPRYSGPLTPTAPRLWETFTLALPFSVLPPFSVWGSTRKEKNSLIWELTLTPF